MIVMITGGQRSGKSSYAEGLLNNIKDVGYIATAVVEDEEMKERVKKHQKTRPSIWNTYEGYRDIKNLVNDEKYYILECVGTLVSNILYEHTKDVEDIDDDLIETIEKDIEAEIMDFVEYVRKENKSLYIVTNEVGMSLASEYKLSRVYMDVLGKTNQLIGKLCDQAYLVVAGMELRLK